MSLEQSYRDAKSIENKINMILTDEANLEVDILETNSAVHKDALSDFSIELDFTSMTAGIVGRIVDEIHLSVNSLYIKEDDYSTTLDFDFDT